MDKILDFLSDNLLAVIAAGLFVMIFVVLIMTVVTTKKAKKRKAEEYENIIKNAPVVDLDEDVAAVESEKPSVPTKPADFAWLAEPERTVRPSAVKREETKRPAPEPAVKEYDKTQKGERRIAGKWVVKEKGEGEFVAFLYANNGEIILTSEIYSSGDGAKKGIATIRKNVISDGNFVVYCDKNGQYYFKLKSAGNRFLCSGETYQNRSACLSSIESVKRFIDSPVSDAVEKDITVIKYEASDGGIISQKSGYSGKWKIINVEDGYIATLYASNGEVLLSSETYQSSSSAKSAVSSIKTNGLAGNFIIDSDKKGRYFFKLRNAQKSTLCVGETYSQLSACQKAIDSVRRFLRTAKLVEEE
ncbi:MAG: YegP family protein [Clostridia bacterium]|nr:YegP family protein [Clostridia bacterium]